ncbi:MAG: helix-turn-helix transcriptional regulator [Syntrophorhabdus sp.]
MKKRKAVSGETAIDNTLNKSIIPQSEPVNRQDEDPRVPGEVPHNRLYATQLSTYFNGITIIYPEEYLNHHNLDHKTMLNKDAIFVLAKPPEHKPNQSTSNHKKKWHKSVAAKKLSAPVFGHRTKTALLASNFVLMKVTEVILGNAKAGDLPNNFIFSDDKITIWLSESGRSVCGPALKTAQEWKAEKRGWMVAIHLLFCAYAVASSNTDRSFVLRLSEVINLLGLKSIKRREERINKIIEGVRLLSRLSYTLNWPKTGKIKGFNLLPDLLWKTEIEEVVEEGKTVDYRIKVTPGLWADHFLNINEGYLQYTTIAEEVFDVISEFWQKRPDIVRLMCSVIYLKRINKSKNERALTVYGDNLLEIMCEPAQVEKILSGDSRQRGRFIMNLHSALVALSEKLGWQWKLTSDFYDEMYDIPEEYKISDEAEGQSLLAAVVASQKPITKDDLTDILRSKLNLYFEIEPKIKKQKTSSVIKELAAFRTKRCFTQKEMAKNLGISLSYYKKIERSVREPTDHLIRKMKKLMKKK